MNHVAIDLGKKKSQICTRSEDGRIVKEGSYPTLGLAGLMEDWTASRVVVETCAEAFFVAKAARSQGHEVGVVPATLVKTLGVGARGVKNDRRDAQVLSEVLGGPHFLDQNGVPLRCSLLGLKTRRSRVVPRKRPAGASRASATESYAFK